MSVEYRHYVYTDSKETVKVADTKRFIAKLKERGLINVTDVYFIPSPIIPMGKDKEDTLELLRSKYEYGLLNAYGEQYIKRYNPLDSFMNDSSIDSIEEYVVGFNTKSEPGEKGLVEMFDISDFSYSVAEEGISADIAICSSKLWLIQPQGEMDFGIKDPQGEDIEGELAFIRVKEGPEGVRMYFTGEFNSEESVLEGEYTLYGKDAMDNTDSSRALRPTHYGMTVELFGSTPNIDTLQTSELFKDILRESVGVEQTTDGGVWH